MKFETNKEKGNAGLALAIGYYGSNGYTVSLPLNDTQDYDLIVDDGTQLLKVQVKATSRRNERGDSLVYLRSMGGTKGIAYKTVIDTNIDILFIVTELAEMYQIPADEIIVATELTMNQARQKYRVDVHIENIIVKEEKEEKIYYCLKCGKEISGRTEDGLCHDCAMEKRRTVERPSKEILLQEIQEQGFAAIGRKYNVSDNAIRKWCKAYNLPTTSKEIKEYKMGA